MTRHEARAFLDAARLGRGCPATITGALIATGDAERTHWHDLASRARVAHLARPAVRRAMRRAGPFDGLVGVAR